ncbi:MAG TPA: DNA polymerase IV [Beijerinckiaceae bacterium]|nr:DNA polymerase IV [Beijerinckiaceae bacterium]
MNSGANAALCCECLATSADRGPRCAACGSPRLLRHPELDALTIAHVDCDAFYAAVEKRDNPGLLDQPVIIGGGRRGVVATACYIARTFGVRSAMPMFHALAACPNAVVIRPDMTKYAQVGRQVRAMMLELTPLVEPLSIDEAFLDLAGTERLHGASPAVILARFARRIESELGITVSVGLSYCKFLAKIASDLDKPRGFALIGRSEALGFLSDKPVGLIWGVGKVAQRRLESDGYRRIADLQKADLGDLLRRYGAEGGRLWRLARGLDDRTVSPSRETKGLSAETTFESDVADPERLVRALFLLCEKLSDRLTAQGLAGKTVTLKLKTRAFQLRTRSRTLPEATRLATRLFDAGRDLLRKEATGDSFRLIGIGASDLVAASEGDRGDLADASPAREKATQDAVDKLRAKFGRSAVVRGLVFKRRGDEE